MAGFHVPAFTLSVYSWGLLSVAVTNWHVLQLYKADQMPSGLRCCDRATGLLQPLIAAEVETHATASEHTGDAGGAMR